MRYAAARLEDIERLPAFGQDHVWRPIRHHFGIEAFGTNAYSADEAGERVIEEHDELGAGGVGGHQELYVVLSGRATFTLDGEEVDAPAVSFVFIADPAVRRGAVTTEPATSVLVIGGPPGRAFTVSPWEWSFRGLAKPYAEAVEIFEEGMARFPGNASLPYNLACRHALEGRHSAAIEALGWAVELEPKARQWAAEDEDFASLRGSSEFEAVIHPA